MKLAIKLALLGGSLFAAGSALADIAPITSSNGGELFLVVIDTATNSYYTRGLGITLGQIESLGEGSQQANSAQTGPTLLAGTAGNAALNSALNIGADANLTAWLAANSTGTKTYEIAAGWNPGTTLSDGVTAANAYLSTSARNIFNGGTYVASPVTNISLNTYATIATNITGSNNAIPGSTAGDGSSGSALLTAGGSPTTSSANLTTWYSRGFGGVGSTFLGTIALGSSGGLFIAATNTTGNSSAANLWQVGNVTLSTSGALSFTGNPGAAVPLPAAVWLLGSSLLGLVGVGRRRRAA